MDLYQASERFVRWLENKILLSARGDNDFELKDVSPKGKFWLGRLAPEEAVIASGMGERGERLDPCAIGMRLLPADTGPWHFVCVVSFRVWLREEEGRWRKTDRVEEQIAVSLTNDTSTASFGEQVLRGRLDQLTGCQDMAAEVRTELRTTIDGQRELTVLLVNSSAGTHKDLKDTNLYECSLQVRGLPTRPFLLEALPDSFRYDRRVPAYGINGGVVQSSIGSLATTDIVSTDKLRPRYWNATDEQPNFTFTGLANEPIAPARALVTSLRRWGETNWSENALDRRAEAEHWNVSMREEAKSAAAEFAQECRRIETGVELLERSAILKRSFCLMNEAMALSAKGRYDRWRPFQLGFLLANLHSVGDVRSEAEIVDIVWFATGGGKTETYLGLLITAALHDRLTGKRSGITAWSRFPLRMLSLQQTQRFADAMAAAELVRRRDGIEGDSFSVGFLVGQGATPNSIEPNHESTSKGPDPDDEAMPAMYKVLLACPFCKQLTIEMRFNRRLWKLEHCCTNDSCEWPDDALPFYIVDDEIYRFLPTVVVGTLDKAASIAIKAAMRGLVGPPLGQCPTSGHGYVYASRSKMPNGCLVPGCTVKPKPLEQDPKRFAPSYRLQDELHLLKDSLGAVDAHYEALYDELQNQLSERVPKILASSATLTGYQKQVDTLYRRAARVFPLQGPSATDGFWTKDSPDLMRRFVAVAPRGVTIEYAVDRLLTELQFAIRQLIADPSGVCEQIGVDAKFASELVSLYGTDVVYGQTLRDLDAVTRSLESQQVRVEGPVNTASLTGKTGFDEVRTTLDRLNKPESDFKDRLHVIAASSMMSHGVDIDRLNVMVMLGLPLTTAEFIQSTARVGRRWPGLVFVVHKIGRERDAGVYRSFDKYVQQGDRFVEPIPITRRSRRVLERTIAGIELARILAIYEPMSGGALTTVSKLRDFVRKNGLTADNEAAQVAATLGLDDSVSEPLRRDLQRWFDRFFRNLEDPGGNFRFPSDLSPTEGPMLSLRDVEEVAPIYGSYSK